MKRILSTFIATVLLITCCIGTSLAASEVDTYASLTLSYYYAEMFNGGKGKASIDFYVSSNKFVDEIGVDSIKIYESDGDYVKTISGTISNGLIGLDSYEHGDFYDEN